MTETVSRPLDPYAENYDGVHIERGEAPAGSRAFLDLMRQRRVAAWLRWGAGPIAP
jgi:hypothetical protein